MDFSFKISKVQSETANRIQCNDQMKSENKGQTTIYKILHKKIKIDQHELHQKPGEASEW